MDKKITLPDGKVILSQIYLEESKGIRTCQHCYKRMPKGSIVVKIMTSGSICKDCFTYVFLNIAGPKGFDLIKDEVAAAMAADNL